MKYYLDTNIIIYAINDKYPNIKKHIMKLPSYSIVIPTMVLSEIEYGARKSYDYEKTIFIYRKFMDTFNYCSFDEKASLLYGEIKSNLEKNGNIIGPNDLIIASTVLSDNGILITHNTNEFSRIENLKIEDWTEV